MNIFYNRRIVERKLKERFEVYNIDEFRTSCLHHKTENKCKNLYLEEEFPFDNSSMTPNFEDNEYSEYETQEKITSSKIIDKTINYSEEKNKPDDLDENFKEFDLSNDPVRVYLNEISELKLLNFDNILWFDQLQQIIVIYL